MSLVNLGSWGHVLILPVHILCVPGMEVVTRGWLLCQWCQSHKGSHAEAGEQENEEQSIHNGKNKTWNKMGKINRIFKVLKKKLNFI